MTQSHKLSRPASAAPSDVSPVVQRWAADVATERQIARVRLLAAAAAFFSGVWLLYVADAFILRALALAGCAFGGLWARQVLRKRTQSELPALHYLELGADYLAIAEGSAPRTIPLSGVRSVEIDEDRLVVVLRLDGAEPWLLEPRYRGMTLRELAEHVHRAMLAARGDAPG